MINHNCHPDIAHGCLCATCARDPGSDGPNGCCCEWHPDLQFASDPESACGERVAACPDYQPETAITAAQDATPAFDYAGLSDQAIATLHSAEDMIRSGYRTAKAAYRTITNAVGMAHDELVTSCHDGRKSEENERTFCAWCESVGLNQRTAYRMLQVSDLMIRSTPNEQKVLEALPITLLYAAAKPSAPPELVERVKKGEIATNKEYQAALKEKDNKIERLERTNRDQKKLLEAGSKTQEMLRRRSEQYAEVCADRDAWKARAEELEARPVEVAVEVDETEVERRAQEKAQALAVEMMRKQAPASDDPEQAEHDAYDAGMQFWRTIDNAWRLARPRASTLRPELKRAIYERCAEIFEKVRKDMTTYEY